MRSTTRNGAKYHFVGRGELQVFVGDEPASRIIETGVFVAFERGSTLLAILPDETATRHGDVVAFEVEMGGLGHVRLTLDGDVIQRTTAQPVVRGAEFHLHWAHMLDHMG